MRQVVKILTYLMVLVLLTAEDCGNNSPPPSPDELRLNVFENIEDEFTSEQLSEKQLAAFEIRAEQKLVEIFDLVNIYADTSLDVQFRQQAVQSIKAAFISKTALDAFYCLLKLEEDTSSEILINQNREFIRLKVDSVKMNNEFTLSSNANYEAELNFSINQQGVILQEKINVVALKTNKNFGSNSLAVWELFFKL